MNPIPIKKKTRLTFGEILIAIIGIFLMTFIPMIILATIIKLVRYILFVL